MDDIGSSPIPVEETPEIPMDMSEGVVPPPPPMPKKSSAIVTIFIFIILFVAGMVLSSYIRPFLPGVGKVITGVIPTPKAVTPIPTQPPKDPLAGWNTYQVTAGVSYRLPPDVPAPTCDGGNCASQGTYLPGGTRLTVAPRGTGQAFTTMYGALVTDANGTAFINKDATVSGHMATEFTGTFTGRTIAGYGFTQMHGLMIKVNPALTLEVNHFSPAGVTTDWDRDDALFTQIISTLNFSSAVPVATTTPKAATPSGY